MGDYAAFGGVAKDLSRSPLGIIALFVVLVYGIAGLVTGFSGSLLPQERIILVYFLVVFPIVILGSFCWLVSQHAPRLYSPGDFRDEENYVRIVASLAAASASKRVDVSHHVATDLDDIVSTARRAGSSRHRKSSHRRILWVDDHPPNNRYERRALESAGFEIATAVSTAQGLELFEKENPAIVISDMGRKEGPREGYKLLEEVRSRGYSTPFFLYTSSNAPEHRVEAIRRGAQGATNDPNELFNMIVSVYASA